MTRKPAPPDRRKQPRTGSSHKHLANLLRTITALIDSGLLNKAEGYCQQAYDLAPNDVDVLLQFGSLRYFQKRFHEAVSLLKKAMELSPENTTIRTFLLASYKDNNDFKPMLALANQFQEQRLNASELALAYSAYLRVCDWKAIEKIGQRVLAAARQGKLEHGLLPALLMASNGMTDISPEFSYLLHKAWGNLHKCNIHKKRISNIHGRIRIAYLSGDFRHHPVAYFMHQIIASHNRDEFEVFCYAQLHGQVDDVTRLFQKDADHFIDTSDMDDAALEEHMQNNGIHIAIDLASHTYHTRLPAFARRLAPVQISYLGYPNTTGLDEMDFHITDHFAEDIDNGTKYSEELLFMPDCFLCYAMQWDVEKTDVAPVEKSSIVTFACFNDSRKLNPEVIKTWSRILEQVENSRLLLKFVGSEHPIIRNNIINEFTGHGIDARRIEVLERTEKVGDHMLSYHDVDISLDPFPYTGTTTTCESISQGVPVITLVGPKHANRVSYSILKNIGFEETIAWSKDEYIEKAVNLANKPGALGILRKTLPLLLQYSPLKQTGQFIANLENLYRRACEKKGISLIPTIKPLELFHDKNR